MEHSVCYTQQVHRYRGLKGIWRYPTKSRLSFGSHPSDTPKQRILSMCASMFKLLFGEICSHLLLQELCCPENFPKLPLVLGLVLEKNLQSISAGFSYWSSLHVTLHLPHQILTFSLKPVSKPPLLSTAAIVIHDR